MNFVYILKIFVFVLIFSIFVEMVSLNKEYNQIVNLVKFNVNFSKFIHNNELLSHDPSYILEKYNHWIGFEPTVEHKMYTPDDMTTFFLNYGKRWATYDRYCKVEPSISKRKSGVKNILMYLYSTQRMNLVQMSEKFEEYIGPMSMISDVPDKKGLHHLTEKFVGEVLEKNKDNVKIVLRDMKIGSII
jgi:hypothetical protein